MGLTINGCCGGSLRSDGIIHGWIGIAFFLLLISSQIGRITRYDPDEVSSIYSYNSGSRTNLQNEQITLVAYLVDVLFSGLLLIGIAKNKHYMLLPWLIYRGLGLVISIPFAVLMLVLSSLTLELESILVSLIYLVIVGLFVWSWIVIYSLFEEIRKMMNKKVPMQLPFYESQSPAPPYKVYE